MIRIQENIQGELWEFSEGAEQIQMDKQNTHCNLVKMRGFRDNYLGREGKMEILKSLKKESKKLTELVVEDKINSEIIKLWIRKPEKKSNYLHVASCWIFPHYLKLILYSSLISLLYPLLFFPSCLLSNPPWLLLRINIYLLELFLLKSSQRYLVSLFISIIVRICLWALVIITHISVSISSTLFCPEQLFPKNIVDIYAVKFANVVDNFRAIL